MIPIRSAQVVVLATRPRQRMRLVGAGPCEVHVLPTSVTYGALEREQRRRREVPDTIPMHWLRTLEPFTE